MRPLRFVVIGLNGYSLIHLEAIQWLAKQNLARLTGVIALETDRVKQPQLVKTLQSQRVTLYDNIATFLEKYADTADILTVPLGIHQHVPVSVAAMQAGLDVYCEKPIAATIQEVDHLIQTKQKTGRKIVIGFQHIYSRSIQNLKARICDRRLGKVHSIKLLHGWPRSERYYTRNDWAGRLRLDKLWVLDSPANNAMAHYLLNLLYLSSTHPGQTAVPIKIRAELYRANLIEGADMTQIKFITLENTQAWVIFTHSNSFDQLPFMQIECENGRAYWQGDEGHTFIQYHDGHSEQFDNLVQAHWRFEGFKNLVQAIQNKTQPICTPALARPHTLTINAMHESCPKIVTIPNKFIVEKEDRETFPPFEIAKFRRLKNLDEHMRIAFEEQAFFSELAIPWAKSMKSDYFEIKKYNYFPQHRNINLNNSNRKGRKVCAKYTKNE